MTLPLLPSDSESAGGSDDELSELIELEELEDDGFADSSDSGGDNNFGDPKLPIGLTAVPSEAIDSISKDRISSCSTIGSWSTDGSFATSGSLATSESLATSGNSLTYESSLTEGSSSTEWSSLTAALSLTDRSSSINES